jgi:hypothetical protein
LPGLTGNPPTGRRRTVNLDARVSPSMTGL